MIPIPAKEKAKELIELFTAATMIPAGRNFDAVKAAWEVQAKKCALIHIDEILSCRNKHDGYIICDKVYFREVRNEIEKL